MISWILFLTASWSFQPEWVWQAQKEQSVGPLVHHNNNIYLATSSSRGYLAALTKEGQTLWTFHPESVVRPGSSFGIKSIHPHQHPNGSESIYWGTAWSSRSYFSLTPKGDSSWVFDTLNNPSSEDSGWVLTQSVVSDLNNDGFSESLVGVGEKDRGLYLLDGQTGVPLWRRHMDNGSPFTSLSVDDLNGDGISDMIVGESGPGGHVTAINGDLHKSGEVLWSHNAKATLAHLLSVGDLNNDGINDIASFDWAGRITGLSGATGEAFYYIHTDIPFSTAIQLSDINRDGIKEGVAVGSRPHFVAIDFKKGEILWKYEMGREPGEYVWALESLSCNGDSIADALVGSFGGFLTCIDGKTGEKIFEKSISKEKILSLLVGDNFVGVGTQMNLSTESGGSYFHFLKETLIPNQ